MVEELSDVARSRRTVLSGLAAAGIGVPLLAACGASSSSSSSALVHQQQQQAKTGTSKLTPLVKTSEVPVGGGVILHDAVVTQPSAGEFKAFSPVCTHQGCTVAQVQNQQILCPCHGSAFSISTGAVEGGPAPSPLPTISITTKNGEVYAT
ncbi:MAG: Rieske (2Fe-2S) protein [Marmoricola sp.]